MMTTMKMTTEAVNVVPVYIGSRGENVFVRRVLIIMMIVWLLTMLAAVGVSPQLDDPHNMDSLR